MTGEPQAGAPLSRITLKVEAGVADDFESSRWAVSPLFTIDASDPSNRASYQLSSEIHASPDFAIAVSQVSPTRFDRTERVIAKSGLDGIVAQIYTQGHYALETGGRETLVRPGDIAFFDMTRTSRIQASRSSILMMGIARRLLNPHIADLEALHGRVLPRGDPLNVLLTSHMRAFSQVAPRLSVATGPSVVRATCDLLAACAAPATTPAEIAAEALSAASLRRIQREIDRRIGDPALHAEFLSRTFNMSRASLYRMFEPLGGVASYVQRRRLTYARQALSDGSRFNERIGVIAQRCGFTDNAVFSRAFRKAHGVSPREMRALRQQCAVELASKGAEFDGSFRSLNRWLSGFESRPVRSDV